MRTTKTAIALLALPALALAVQLSDFTLRGERNQDVLSTACQNIYTENIQGCSETDFRNPPCSTSCINALVGLIGPIFQACGNDNLKGPSIMYQFLQGNGPESLCLNDPRVTSAANAGYLNVQSSTAMGYGSSTSSPQTSQAASTTSPSMQSSNAVVKSSAASSTSQASSAKTSANAKSTETVTSTAQASATDSNASSTDSSAASKTESSGSSQTNLNDHSGGGSPFDTNSSTGSASALSSSTMALVLALAGAMLALQR